MDFLGIGHMLAKLAQLARDPRALAHLRRSLLANTAIWLAIVVGLALLYLGFG